MASQGLQIMGVMFAFLGWMGTIISCALPMWRVTALVEANIVTAQVIWEGLWMTCSVRSSEGDPLCDRRGVGHPHGHVWREVHQLHGGRNS